MKKSISTFLKHTAQDKVNRSANPAVVRASTIFFKSMQELLKHIVEALTTAGFADRFTLSCAVCFKNVLIDFFIK